jgi:hypothetical protein
MPAGIHNGALTQGATRARIVEAISQGENISSICLRERMSPQTVRAIREAEWCKVEQRKSILAAQSERIATQAADRISQELASNRKIPVSQLVPIYGVAVDKVNLLRATDSPVSQHLHLHLQSSNISAQFNELLGSIQHANAPLQLSNELQPCNDNPVISVSPNKVALPASGKAKKARARPTAARDAGANGA